jgi:AAA15 family ATPase/GTPase
MLVKVSVENFKSFDKAAELTMISSNKIRTNANHRLKIKSTQLLKYAVVYGANASGKTNLALFLKFFKDSVCNGIPIEATQMFCKNRQENKERESSFEIQITVGDKFYAYGFSAVLSRRKVTGEWLYELYQNGSAKCLFEREGSKRPVLNDGITLTNTEKNKFETYAGVHRIQQTKETAGEQIVTINMGWQTDCQPPSNQFYERKIMLSQLIA